MTRLEIVVKLLKLHLTLLFPFFPVSGVGSVSLWSEIPARSSNAYHNGRYFAGHGYREVPQGLQDPEFVELGFPTLITTVSSASCLSLFRFIKNSSMEKPPLFSFADDGYLGVGSAGRSEDPGHDVSVLALLRSHGVSWSLPS